VASCADTAETNIAEGSGTHHGAASGLRSVRTFVVSLVRKDRVGEQGFAAREHLDDDLGVAPNAVQREWMTCVARLAAWGCVWNARLSTHLLIPSATASKITA
jgi:hypothetical protein